MATISEAGMIGQVYAATEDTAFLRMLVSKIQRRRAELGEGQWLSEDLRIALEEMAPILGKARVSFELVRGVKRTVVIKPIRSGRPEPSNQIEACSIKMMVGCLTNPSNQFLSHALEPESRQARQQLIANLRGTCDLLSGSDPLDGVDRHHDSRDSANAGGSVPADEATQSALLAALRVRKQEEQKQRLLDSVLDMSTAVVFRRANEAAFQRIFDDVWEEVKVGSLLETIAAGKILDRIYSLRTAKSVPSVAAAAPAPPAFLEDPVPSVAEERTAPARAAVQAATPASSPRAKAVQLPAILDNWVGQGLTAHRIFRDLQKASELEKQVRRWTKMATDSRVDVEYLLILRILGSVTTFTADDEIVTVPVPVIPVMGFAQFEKVIAQGKANGVYDIDRRIWGVIGGVYSFVKSWLEPQLSPLR